MLLCGGDTGVALAESAQRSVPASWGPLEASAGMQKSLTYFGGKRAAEVWAWHCFSARVKSPKWGLWVLVLFGFMYLTDCAVPARALALIPDHVWVELGSVAHMGHIPVRPPLGRGQRQLHDLASLSSPIWCHLLRKEDCVHLLQWQSLFYSGKQGVLRSFTLLASWFGGGLAWFPLLLFVFLLLLVPEVFPSHLPAPGAEWSRNGCSGRVTVCWGQPEGWGH